MKVEKDERKVPLGGARRGEGEDKGRITEGGQGAAEETAWGNGRGERSIGIETRRTEALVRVSPPEPLRLAKRAAHMNPK